MAHTLTQYWYALTPTRAVALIGEDHMGEWTRTPAGVAVVDAVVEWHTSRRRVPTLWHEGESSAISDSFKAFTAHFKKEYGISYTVKKWEPPQSAVKYTRENLLLIGLMAGDAGQTRRHLGTSGIYIERLLQTDSWKAESGTRYTADEILELVDKGVHAKRYRELLHSEITDSTLREWFELREEAFENPQSKLFKIMSEPQYSREDGLARLLRSQNGIYLVGESHIPTMRDRGLLK